MSNRAARAMPALATGVGIDHWRYRTRRVATSVGPGTVLTTRAQRGQIRPRAAREPRHEDPGRAGAGDVGDRAGSAQKRDLRGGQPRERGPDRVVIDHAR